MSALGAGLRPRRLPDRRSPVPLGDLRSIPVARSGDRPQRRRGRPGAASNGKQRVQRRILGSRGGARHTRSANTPTEATRSRCRAVPQSPDRVTSSTEGLLRFGGSPVPWCGSVGDRPQRGSTATARTPAMPLVGSTSRHFAQPDQSNQLWRSPSTTSVLQTSKSCLGWLLC